MTVHAYWLKLYVRPRAIIPETNGRRSYGILSSRPRWPVCLGATELRNFHLPSIATTAGITRLEVLILVSGGDWKFIFDLCGIEETGSAAYGFLMECWSAAREAGEDLRLATANPRVIRLCRIVRLDAVLPFYRRVAATSRRFDLARGAYAGSCGQSQREQSQQLKQSAIGWYIHPTWMLSWPCS